MDTIDISALDASLITLQLYFSFNKSTFCLGKVIFGNLYIFLSCKSIAESSNAGIPSSCKSSKSICQPSFLNIHIESSLQNSIALAFNLLFSQYSS